MTCRIISGVTELVIRAKNQRAASGKNSKAAISGLILYSEQQCNYLYTRLVNLYAQTKAHMIAKPGFIIWSMTIVCNALAIAAVSNTLAQTSAAARAESIGILLICLLAAAASLWRLIRLYRTAAEVVDIARVPVGVLMRPSRQRPLIAGIAIIAIGTMLLTMVNSLTLVLYWGAWLLIAGGAVMLVCVAVGVMPVGGITLRKDGLVLAFKGTPIVFPWELISAVEGGEFGGNPAIFLNVDALETIAVAPAKQRAFLHQVSFCQQAMQADFYFPTGGYGIGLASLVAAIEHYRVQERSAVGMAG